MLCDTNGSEDPLTGTFLSGRVNPGWNLWGGFFGPSLVGEVELIYAVDGGFKCFFIFTPIYLGKVSNLTSIFFGWNHQPIYGCRNPANSPVEVVGSLSTTIYDGFYKNIPGGCLGCLEINSILHSFFNRDLFPPNELLKGLLLTTVSGDVTFIFVDMTLRIVCCWGAMSIGSEIQEPLGSTRCWRKYDSMYVENRRKRKGKTRVSWRFSESQCTAHAIPYMCVDLTIFVQIYVSWFLERSIICIFCAQETIWFTPSKFNNSPLTNDSWLLPFREGLRGSSR